MSEIPRLLIADLGPRIADPIVTDAGCWEWQGCIDTSGYGKWRWTGAHRVTYRLLVGPIPDGLQLDHLCRNTLCINPAHLEPVTDLENKRRRYALYTHCKNGHEFNEENTYSHAGRRYCRACNRATAKRLADRKKASA